MAARNDVEGFSRSEWTFWEVLENVLQVINHDNVKMESSATKSLVHNSSILLARLMEELVSHASGTYVTTYSKIKYEGGIF